MEETNNTNYPDILFNKLKDLSRDNTNTTLFDYQQHVYNYIIKMNKRGILLYHSVGSGKCMDKNTPILMYNGKIKLIKDILIGDVIMGDDSTPRKILTLARGSDKMYNIIYGNNNNYIVNSDHILVLKNNSYPKIKKDIDNQYYVKHIKYNKPSKIYFLNQNDAEKYFNSLDKSSQIIEISVKDYLNLPIKFRNKLRGFKKEISFFKKNITINPYKLGYWLGSNDLEKKQNLFYTELKSLNLINNKHIPHNYKCNHKKIRLEILAGIIDSCAELTENGYYMILDSLLAMDIIYLCNSIGILSKYDKVINKIKIYIYGKEILQIPVINFKNIVIGNESFNDGYKIQVKFQKIDYYYGFTINGNNRYVLGDFTITHNTMTSISIAEYFKNMGKEIIILSSKSLQSNYKKEIINYNKLIKGGEQNLDMEQEILDDIEEENNLESDDVLNGYKFVTSNARNMINILQNKSTKRDISGIENILENINKTSLENKVIIVDEAHNLFNSISNGSKLANEFYEMIMASKNIKLIFLTGTPIINDPFEISICFNMLYGPIYNSSNKKKKNYITIMPEYYTDFKKFFIDPTGIKIKNEEKFKNRTFGLVSYYGDMYFEKQLSIADDLKKTMIKENYPDRLPIKFEIIEMSQLQNIEYAKARDKEKHESSFKGGAIVKDKNLASTSYRIKSRQLSNIYLDPTIKLEKYNINKYSPKLEAIFNNINNNHKSMINVVYSTFLEYGIIAFSKILELNNYKLYNEKGDESTKYYAIYSGSQTPEERENILKIINDDDNKYGKNISVLLISKSGTEGLDIKCVRSIHIMEPYWNFSLLQQIIARGVRYKSHIALKEDERNVQTYIYLSDYNKDYLQNEKNKIKERGKKKKESIEFTTDINMFKNALKNQELIYKFLKCIASTSIECPLFNKNLNFDCFSCTPNNKKLYDEDIQVDMTISNNCIRSKKVKAEEIIIDNIKYYFTKNDGIIEVFEYNKFLDGYTKSTNKDVIEKINMLNK